MTIISLTKEEKVMARLDYELVKTLLKPPLQVIGITTQTDRPMKTQFEVHFNSLEEVYAFFRSKRPEGRWLIWIQSSDGQETVLDSKIWEEALSE
jgi:hypothetical protein